MPEYFQHLFVGESTKSFESDAMLGRPSLFTLSQTSTDTSVYEVLVFKVRRQPKDLLAHWRRIYFCYQNALPEQLYAALLDLLLILNNKGRAFSQRLILGSRSLLDLAQLSALKKAYVSLQQVQGNRFSLFTSGLIGSTVLLEISEKMQEQHDYLLLANDFIEFSQLEEAMTVLEAGLEKYPARQDLQAAVLQLYKSTGNQARFQNQYEMLARSGVALIKDWQVLASFFTGKAL